jgi:DNA-binding protein Fis
MLSYVAKSHQVRQIIKGLELTRPLYVSSIIIGEPHTGKKALFSHLFPDTPVVSGHDQDATESALQSHDEVIITNFEKLKNQDTLDFEGKRIMATADYMGNQKTIDKLFAFIYMMPSLRERPDDTAQLKHLFLSIAKREFMIDDTETDTDTLPTDLTENAKSLKRCIYRNLIMRTMGKEDIQESIYNYLSKHLDGINGYREHLDIYEKPLIEAGLYKYGSQLKLSRVLGINRNTLRKKIHEHSID